LPEFGEINEFIAESLLNNQLNRKRLVVEKGIRVFFSSVYRFSG
jgi:hypothetical protein